jgi:hypothetical protein
VFVDVAQLDGRSAEQAAEASHGERQHDFF